eukprot:GCRY01002097.1.p1 GENE.GCRY01002097.1~~GCRY01002097.1.p1  ORF type:complete len:308 (+),score=22.79 GCRY01002097.1:291-1214(+)
MHPFPFLYQSMKSPFFIDEEDYCPVIDAIRSGSSKEVIEDLIRENPYEVDEQGRTVLHWAARVSRVDIIRFLICGEYYPVDVKTPDGDTPLMDAVDSGCIDSTALLLSVGASCVCENDAGDIPLHFAVSSGHVECVDMLLRVDADIQLKHANEYGDCALHIAALNGSEVLCRQLLLAGSDRLQTNVQGAMAIHFAASKGNIGVLDLLLEKEPVLQLYHRDCEDFTPLYWARKNLDAVCHLSEYMNQFKADFARLQAESERTDSELAIIFKTVLVVVLVILFFSLFAPILEFVSDTLVTVSNIYLGER